MEKKHNIPEYNISEFNRIIREVVENNFGYIRLRGEISEIRPATKGQLYLTLKDNDSILSGVIWSTKLNYIQFKPLNSKADIKTYNSWRDVLNRYYLNKNM